jgi:hypothetical protein
MAQEVLKTEHPHPLAALLRSAQMSSVYLTTADSFVIPLEKLRESCGAKRADILQLVAESAVTHGGFAIFYEPERDRIHFDRIRQPDAGALASPIPQVAAQATPVAMVGSAQKVDSSMSAEQVVTIAKREWANDPKIRSEFTTEARYVAWRRAEVSGRARIYGRTVSG